MQTALIVIACYAAFAVVLHFLFPRTTVNVYTPQVPHEPRFYSCGCRIEGAVGVPGCDDCTEPGLR